MVEWRSRKVFSKESSQVSFESPHFCFFCDFCTYKTNILYIYISDLCVCINTQIYIYIHTYLANFQVSQICPFFTPKNVSQGRTLEIWKIQVYCHTMY